MPDALWIIWLIAAYVSGSIPYALLLGLAKGVDIREHGSGNVGASNAGRTLGRKWGILCFLLDVLKGLIPVLGYGLMSGAAHGEQSVAAAFLWLLVGVAAVLGHIFPVWLKFKGGKGAATGLGVMLGFWPVLTLPGIAAGVVWFVMVKATGYISLASIVAAATLPLLALIACVIEGQSPGGTGVFVGLTLALAALVVVRHRDNIVRLRAGTESKAAWAKK